LKAFEYLNPDGVMKEIRRDENRNMARFMKRVAKYGSKSAFTSKKEVPTSPKEIG
jgi:hypothetical protein